jgi:CBS domain-containing protein/ribosome-associated translation inhibitor RaiA
MMIKDIMTRKVYSLSKQDTLSKAIYLMIEKRFHQIPIVEEGYEGMVFLRDLVKSRADPTKTKLEKFITHTPILKENENIENAIKILVGSGLRALPVIENKKIVGILSETDIVLNLKNILKNIKASKIMSKVVSIPENEKLKTVLRVMERNNISSIPLIDWKEEISGCINIFSIARFLYQKKERIESFKSAKERENILNNPAKNFSFFPYIIDINTSLEEVAKLLQKGEEVVVAENKKPIGIIKARDIIESLVPKEKITIIISGIDEKDIVFDIFEKVSEKWRKLGVEKIVIQIEKIGTREKYFGKIKVFTDKEILTASSQTFDIYSLSRDLKEKMEREILKEKEKKKDYNKKEALKVKGE